MNARSLPPSLTAPVAPRLPDVHTVPLPNGLHCFLIEQHALPVIDVRLIARGGAQLDPPSHAGRARLLAELLDQGTATRAATEIADQAELLGATLETRATWDTISVALHVLAPRFDHAFDLLADIVRAPAFLPAELERKRSERLAAMLQDRNEPRVLASQLFHRHAYPADHPFSAPPGGTPSSIENLSRSDIVDLYAKTFAPARCCLIIVGDITREHALASVDRGFGDWSGGAAEPAAAALVVPHTERSLHIVDRPAAPQSELRVGLAGPARRTPDFFPLLVGNTVLGGAFTSRLNMRLREEKAYTYGAGSSFALRTAGGPFVASTAVATAATADAIAVMVREIARMAAEPVTAAELERAREYLVLGLARTFETTADLAQHVAELALHQLPLSWYDTFASAVRGVDAAAVQRAAGSWLKADRLTIAVAGDAARVRDEIESLNIGAVHVHESI